MSNKESKKTSSTNVLSCLLVFCSFVLTPVSCYLAMTREDSPLILPFFAIGVISFFIESIYMLFSSVKTISNYESNSFEPEKIQQRKQMLIVFSTLTVYTGIFSVLALLALFTSFIDTTKLMVYFIGMFFIALFINAIIYCMRIKNYVAVAAFSLLILLLLNAFAYDLLGLPMLYELFNLIWVVRVVLFLLIFATRDNARHYSQLRKMPSYANIRKHRAFILWLQNAAVHYISIVFFIVSLFYSLLI